MSGASDNIPPAGPAAPDLAYAPPPFRLPGGERVTFVDFTEADCDIRIRRLDEPGAVDVTVVSRLAFVSAEHGHPAFCLRQPIATLAVDGQPASAVSVQAPDGVCDFKMVEMTGLEFFRELRPTLQSVFVLMTGSHDDAEVQRFARIHGKRVLHKPFTAAELHDCLTCVSALESAP